MSRAGISEWPKPGRSKAIAATAAVDERRDDLQPVLPVAAQPVHEDDDPMVPLRHAFEYEDLIPDARAVVFPRTGHAPMLEEPERFNAALRGFLHEDARR